MPFVGELRIYPSATIPPGWIPCDGRALPISENQALFAVLGTRYGGDGQTTFGVPDVRGRVPVGTGGDVALGQKGGDEVHTLATGELAGHSHVVQGAPTAATTADPDGAVLAAAPIWGPPADITQLEQATVAAAGADQPHPNMQPYLALNVCIAANGIVPTGA